MSCDRVHRLPARLVVDYFTYAARLVISHFAYQWRSHQYGEPWRPPHLAAGKPPHPLVIPAGLLAAAQLHCAITERLSLETKC
jgi:hypothetical protein